MAMITRAESRILMALGAFRFAIGTAAYERLNRAAAYTWATQDRFGRLPALQFTGPALPTIDLDGTLYPQFAGGLGQIDRMRAMGEAGEPLDLVDGTGRVWGLWCLLEVSEVQSLFIADGRPRCIDFALRLQAYGEDA